MFVCLIVYTGYGTMLFQINTQNQLKARLLYSIYVIFC